MQLLSWIENSALGVGISNSFFLYPVILALHSVGMAFVVGVNAAISLRVLGLARGIPLVQMSRLLPVMWIGFWVNFMTGALLAVAGATRILTDPVFYLKMSFVAAAVVSARWMRGELFDEGQAASEAQPSGPRAMVLAVTSLLLWFGIIVPGRLLAYKFFRFWN